MWCWIVTERSKVMMPMCGVNKQVVYCKIEKPKKTQKNQKTPENKSENREDTISFFIFFSIKKNI